MLCRVLCLAIMGCLCLHGQEFWGGTRYGMTKAQLVEMFGRKLILEEPPRSIYGGTAPFTMRVPLCNWLFEVIFLFAPGDGGEPKLKTVYLHSKNRTTELQVGACITDKYTAAYGKPIAEKPFGFSRTFARDQTLVEISTVPKEDLVIIKYSMRPSGI